MKQGEETWRTLERVWIFLIERIVQNLPIFTKQFVFLFCIIPVCLAFSGFCVSFLVNFGVALIAQIISTLIILFILIPTITICLISAIFVAWSFEFLRIGYYRVFDLNIEEEKKIVKEKLKIL